MTCVSTHLSLKVSGKYKKENKGSRDSISSSSVPFWKHPSVVFLLFFKLVWCGQGMPWRNRLPEMLRKKERPSLLVTLACFAANAVYQNPASSTAFALTPLQKWPNRCFQFHIWTSLPGGSGVRPGFSSVQVLWLNSKPLTIGANNEMWQTPSRQQMQWLDARRGWCPVGSSWDSVSQSI